METAVRWSNWKGAGLEHCACCRDDERFIIEGVFAGTREERVGGHYVVRADAAFRTREVRVEYVAGPHLHIVADGEGHWRDLLGTRPLSSLDGCLDVDIGATPATNTLPIRRLKLNEGESRDIAVADVPLLNQIAGDFLPRRADQRYTCLVRNERYRYEGIFRDFTAELDIDEFGLVRDYAPLFRRLL